ncbi:MAG: spore germination protein [Clostridia bacterium]
MLNKTAKQNILEIDSQDLRKRTLDLASKITVVNLDGMSDDQKVSHQVINAIVEEGKKAKSLEELQTKIVFAIKCDILANLDLMKENLYNGYTLLFCQEEERCLCFDTRTELGRAITQPPTNNVTKGPREGFIEGIKANITLLRKRLKTQEFKCDYLSVGKYTNTAIAVCYIENIASKITVNKIKQRIKEISIDGIIDSSYVSRFLDSGKSFLFKLVGSAEKPDVVTGKLLEGRIAIVVDGSPIVLTVPYMFVEDLQGPEDYYDVPEIASVNRILRAVSAFVCVILPSLYVSLQLYNYQILPAKFLISIINSTSTIPFNPLSEMLVILVLFDILREANSRMPSMAGLSLSIIGAVVLGDAAVRAGLLSAPGVMIGALSGIGLYTMPDNTLLLSILRLAVTVVGGLMGLLGIILVSIVLLAHIVSLSAFDVPYTAPYAPSIDRDKQDGLIKLPITRLKNRPAVLKSKNKTRQR